jgi:two-component system NtrC family sensor kinase
MIVRFDAGLRHTYCNPAVERQLGVPVQTFLGKTALEVGGQREQAEFIDRSLRKVLGTGQELQVEQSYPTPSGVKYFQTRIVPEFAPDGRIESLLAITRDITGRVQAEAQREAALEALRRSMEQLKATEAQLIQAAKLAAVGELAAGVAHELNNPLTSVLGFAELLLNTLPLDNPIRHDLEIIARQARRTRDIVRNLLDFARQTKPQRLPADVNQLLCQTLDLVRQHMENSGVVIEEDYTPDLGPLTLDAGQMKQVFLNLITNASHAMPKGGKLRLRTARLGDEVAVAISDTGEGMSPEVREHIFEPFFTTKPVGEGTGLGLSISLGIVQKHGGRIAVESLPGQGSTFTVWLPIECVDTDRGLA